MFMFTVQSVKLARARTAPSPRGMTLTPPAPGGPTNLWPPPARILVERERMLRLVVVDLVV